jgi:uroporphyrinogen-III synthase
LSTEAASLQGLRVLVTRPAAQQQALLEAIAAAGGQAISLPLIAIEPIEDNKQQALLRQQIQELDNYRLLIFISSNAARYGGELIDSYWPQFPQGVSVLAVGPATAEEVSRHLDCEVACSRTGMDSEALLALPLLQDVAGARIAIFRGQGGRELLAQTLRERGARVDYIEVYRREAVSYAADAAVNLITAEDVNVLTVTSGESLKMLRQMLGNNSRLLLLPLIVPSERIAELALQQGFSQVHNANGANKEALLHCLQKLSAEADNKT